MGDSLGFNSTMIDGGVVSEPLEGSDDVQQSMAVNLENSLLEFLSKDVSVTKEPVKAYCELVRAYYDVTKAPVDLM